MGQSGHDDLILPQLSLLGRLSPSRDPSSNLRISSPIHVSPQPRQQSAKTFTGSDWVIGPSSNQPLARKMQPRSVPQSPTQTRCSERWSGGPTLRHAPSRCPPARPVALFLALELTETCPSVLPAPCSRFLCCGALCLHLPPGLLHAAPLHCDRLPRQPALGLPFVGLGLPRGWPRHAALQLPVDVSACPGGRGGGLRRRPGRRQAVRRTAPLCPALGSL